jgi:hypothetical protein
MFVRPHVHTSATKRHSFRFQAQPLLNRMVAAQLDLAARAHNPVPGHVK